MNTHYTELWKQCLNIIKDNVTPEIFTTWFEPIEAINHEGGVFYIKVPSQFFYEYLEEKYATLLRSTIHKVVGPKTKLTYRAVIDNSNPKAGTSDIPAEQFTQKARISNTQNFNSQLNVNYCFDNYIEGNCNKLSRTAGINIASKPGKTIFNPLFLYGNSGVGKTHLANAIGLKAKELHPQTKVLYVSANLFQLQYTDAARDNRVNDFLNFYQMVDVLIIDDIQEFAEGNKTGTQKTFFHIFNHLHQSGKQLILTCDRKPAELKGLNDRLLTRFKWGLSAEIEMPDFDTRKAILIAKIEKDGLEIADDVIDYIAKHVNSNVRDLEGTVISLIAQSTLNQKEIDITLAKRIISNLVHIEEKEHNISSIRDLVCEHFNIPVESVLSRSRRKDIAQARQIAMYFSKKMTQSSLASIGNSIGKRNHATVLHACKTVKDLMETDKSYQSNVQEIEHKLTS